MYLVVGATGFLGQDVAIGLASAGEPVRALTRRPADDSRVVALRAAGAEIVRGDLKDPARVAEACAGVHVVISTASATISTQPGDSIQSVDRDGHLGLIDAARAAGALRFVFVSFSGGFDGDSPLREAKQAVEERVRQSGMEYTILLPSVFMEVWLSPALGFDPVAGRARICGTGRNPISWISLRDVAKYAIAAARGHEAGRNAVLELGGPAAVAPLDVVRTFERLTGRTIVVEHVPEGALRQRFQAASDPLQKSLAALMLGAAAGHRVDMADTARRFGIHATSVDEYARSTLGRGTGV